MNREMWVVIIGGVMLMALLAAIAGFIGDQERKACEQQGREYHCTTSSGWVGGKYATWETCDCVVRR